MPQPAQLDTPAAHVRYGRAPHGGRRAVHEGPQVDEQPRRRAGGVAGGRAAVKAAAPVGEAAGRARAARSAVGRGGRAPGGAHTVQLARKARGVAPVGTRQLVHKCTQVAASCCCCSKVRGRCHVAAGRGRRAAPRAVQRGWLVPTAPASASYAARYITLEGGTTSRSGGPSRRTPDAAKP